MHIHIFHTWYRAREGWTPAVPYPGHPEPDEQFFWGQIPISLKWGNLLSRCRRRDKAQELIVRASEVLYLLLTFYIILISYSLSDS